MLNRILIIFSSQILIFAVTTVYSQKINLQVSGNDEQGYTVDIYYGDRLLIHNTEEFSLRIANTDLSELVEIPSWKGTKWTGDEKNVQLLKDTNIPELDLNLSISVTYEIINENVIKKNVELFQSGMPSLYYTLDETYKPAETPIKYITFENDDFPGGFAHEIFPSAGFVTVDNQVVGILTDAGYKNDYTRTTRRRFNGHGGGFVGMRMLPDAKLVSVATRLERENNQHYVRQTFGEVYNLDAGSKMELKIQDKFQKTGDVEIEKQPGLITLSCYPSDRAGIELTTPMTDQKIYTISFQARGTAPVALKLFRIKNGAKTLELEHGIKYIDHFPVEENEWTVFEGSVLVPYIERDTVSMFIGSQSGEKCWLQIKDLKIAENQPLKQPYNIIPMGEKVIKTTYVFVEPWRNHHDFMISSQLRLAEGLSFEGSEIEKMMYANLNMLTWITAIDDFSPFNVPNMNYSPDMYNRDSFFSIVSTYNEGLNLKIWEQWGKTQTSAGGIATIITPYMGTVEVKGNEATIEWLVWAMLNKRRFGTNLPEDKISKAIEYILNEIDDDRDGICRSHFILGQVDVVDYPEKTDRLAVNQGMLAITLRTAKELGYLISDDYIAKAEQAYRDFYDSNRKHLLFDRNFPDIISLSDLEPEFFSLWLFNRPILTDSMVINQLDHTPVLNKVPDSPHPEFGTTAPVCIWLTDDEKGYSYMTPDYQPFGNYGKANYKDGIQDGCYYNGGSWFRAEYCAYAAGLKHGWPEAKSLMENRVWAEINLNPNWPYSKEFIPTKWSATDSWWPSTRGLCWNVFILMADEVAGLRKPEMDPDFEK